MSDLHDLQWFNAQLAALGIIRNEYIQVALTGDFSASIELSILHEQFSDAEFILKGAGFQVGSAYNGMARWLHVVWDADYKPNVLGAMGFEVDEDGKIG